MRAVLSLVRCWLQDFTPSALAQEAHSQVLSLTVVSLLSGTIPFSPLSLIFFLPSLYYLAPIFLLQISALQYVSHRYELQM